jgi:hypothetical protein
VLLLFFNNICIPQIIAHPIDNSSVHFVIEYYVNCLNRVVLAFVGSSLGFITFMPNVMMSHSGITAAMTSAIFGVLLLASVGMIKFFYIADGFKLKLLVDISQQIHSADF